MSVYRSAGWQACPASPLSQNRWPWGPQVPLWHRFEDPHEHFLDWSVLVMVLRAVHSLGSTTLVLVESNWYSVCQVDGSMYSMTYAVGALSTSAQPYSLGASPISARNLWMGARNELNKDLKAGNRRRREGGKKQSLIRIIGPGHRCQSPNLACWFKLCVWVVDARDRRWKWYPRRFSHEPASNTLWGAEVEMHSHHAPLTECCLQAHTWCKQIHHCISNYDYT